MSVTQPTYNNSLLRGKAPYSDTHTSSNDWINDGLSASSNINGGREVVYDLGQNYDITNHLLITGTTTQIVAVLYDENLVEIVSLDRTGTGTGNFYEVNISSILYSDVRYVSVKNTNSSTSLSLREFNVWGTKSSMNSILIQNSSSYKKYSIVNSSWQTVTSTTPTELDYLQGNTTKEVSQIPESAWQQLVGAVELCYYTDDPNIIEAQFNIETESFTLLDELEGKQISILEYTDNPNQTESIVETETEPFDIYDEFGDTMEVLYYTDDPNKNEAELEITANYSPIDEIEGDFEVVTWTDTLEEASETHVPSLDSSIEGGSVYATEIDLTDVVQIR